MAVVETHAPAQMGRRTTTRLGWLPWVIAALAIAALIITTMVSPDGGAEPTELTRGDVLEELVEMGYLPQQALTTGDIYTQRERATIDAVNGGMVPRQTLDEDVFALKGIIDRLLPSD